MMESLRYVSATIISDIQSGHFRPQAGKTGSLLTLAYVGELVQQTNNRGPLAKFLTKKKKKNLRMPAALYLGGTRHLGFGSAQLQAMIGSSFQGQSAPV